MPLNLTPISSPGMARDITDTPNHGNQSSWSSRTLPLRQHLTTDTTGEQEGDAARSPDSVHTVRSLVTPRDASHAENRREKAFEALLSTIRESSSTTRRPPEGANVLAVITDADLDTGSCYAISRGDGVYTRLIPADCVSTVDIFERTTTSSRGLIILPTPSWTEYNRQEMVVPVLSCLFFYDLIAAVSFTTRQYSTRSFCATYLGQNVFASFNPSM